MYFHIFSALISPAVKETYFNFVQSVLPYLFEHMTSFFQVMPITSHGSSALRNTFGSAILMSSFEKLTYKFFVVVTLPKFYLALQLHLCKTSFCLHGPGLITLKIRRRTERVAAEAYGPVSPGTPASMLRIHW